MCSSIGFCNQCGAQGEIGSKCEYCGSTISAPLTQDNHSMIDSWSDYHLDGFSIVSENVEGKTDSLEFQVIKGDRTGLYGVVDRYGVVRIPCIFNYLKLYLDYNLCCVVKDYCNAVLDVDGKAIIPFGEFNPVGLYVISYGLIYGYNTIYDLQGNQKVKLPVDHRVVLLSDLYASTLHQKGLYSLETGEQLLSDDYGVNEMIDTHLVIVNKVSDGFTRYGIYDCSTRDFALPVEFTSIQSHGFREYEARAQYTQDERTAKSRMLLLTIQDGKLEIEREDIQQYQTGSGEGCLLVLLLPLLLPLALLYLL